MSLQRNCLKRQANHRIVRITAILLWLALALAPGSCQKNAPTLEPPPAPEVVVTEVIQKDVALYSEWVGTTEGFVNAQIHPKVSGYLLKQNYQDGDHVSANELLFQIDDREYKAALDQALGDLAQKQAAFKQNQQDLARYTPLLNAQVISKQEFDHVNQTTRGSKAEVESAQAAVESAKLNMEWTRVTSPIDGIAGIAKTQVGDLVDPTTLLTTVSQLDPIKVSFPISEREYLRFADRIKLHQENGVAKDEPVLEMVLADGSTYKYPGHFYVANRQVNVQTGTIIIQGTFPNPDYILRPGLYAKIRSATDVKHGALLVPQSAVLETQGQYQVAVVGADNKVNMRTVTPGKQIDQFRIIEDGLAPGDRVITAGLQRVSDGMEVKPTLASGQSPAARSSTAGQSGLPSAVASPAS
jgi:membrane fusion protein (multidrug efflux system)